MSDTDEEDADSEAAEPAVDLGDGPGIEGQPIARVASRLTWPAKRSDVRTQEGDSVIRTPDGPAELDAVLADIDVPLFESRSEFVSAVEDAVGRGPVAAE